MVAVSKLIVLEVGEGDFDRGFAVVLRIGETGKPHRVEFRGHFPPAPEIPQLYDRWQFAYYRWGENHSWGRILEPDLPPQTTDVSDWDNCSHAAEQLKAGLQNWFDQPQIRDLRERILENVGREQPARLILQTQHPVLRKLPWHLWQLLDRRPQLEIAISTQDAHTFQQLPNPVKIFVILSSTEGIDIEGDRAMLESLPNATVKLLVEPSDRVLEALKDSRLLKEFEHIFFFARHRYNEGDSETELMWIIDTDRLIPLIVMREPMPIPIAQAFLKYFLKTFSEGESFYLSVRKAREQLHSFEKNYPCASWLPVICQNPTAPDLKYPPQKWKKLAKFANTFASLTLPSREMAKILFVTLGKMQWSQWNAIALLALLVISIGSWFKAEANKQQAYRQIQEDREMIKLEQQGTKALRQFEFQELEALLEAMDAGQGLKKLVQDGRRLEKYPTVSPILALQTILDNIHERNQLAEKQGGFLSASLSPDGNHIVTTSSKDTPKIWDTSGRLLVKLKGNKASTTSAIFSPDSTRIVTISSDETPKIWDISGKLLAELKGNKTSTTSASFSPDGTRIVTTSSEDTPKIWDTSGKLLAELKGNTILTKMTRSAIFSPDSTRIITTSSHDTPKIWDTSGKLLTELKGNTILTTSASFSPNGQFIFTTSLLDTAKLWNISGKLIKEYRFNEDEYQQATGASFSPNGERIITFSESSENLLIWDINGQLIAILGGYQGSVKSVNFSSNGQFILVVPKRSDSKAKVWNMKRGNPYIINNEKFINLNRIRIESAISFSPTGDKLITISSSETQSESNNVVNIWDLSDKRFGNSKLLFGDLRSWPMKYLEYVVASPDGQHILTLDKREYSYDYLPDRTASVWDFSGKVLAKIKGDSYIFQPIFSPDGKHIFTSEASYKDGTIRVWNLLGKLIAQFKGRKAIFSPDGRHILILPILILPNDKIEPQIWDLSGELLTEIKQSYRNYIYVENASFSSDGQRLILWNGDNTTVQVFDFSGKLIGSIDYDRKVKQPLSDIKANLSILDKKLPPPSFSPDGQRILIATYDNTLRLWDLSGKLLTEKTHQDRIKEFSFSSDGKYVLIIFYTGAAQVWDLSGKQFADLKGHQGKIFQASFSPDGQRILTTSNDNIARLWDFSGRLLAEIKILERNLFLSDQELKTAFFSQDGKQIVTASSDRIIHQWRVEGLDELLARGCDWLKDYLATHPEARERLKVCQQK